jgi:hypothetical protein
MVLILFTNESYHIFISGTTVVESEKMPYPPYRGYLSEMFRWPDFTSILRGSLFTRTDHFSRIFMRPACRIPDRDQHLLIEMRQTFGFKQLSLACVSFF